MGFIHIQNSNFDKRISQGNPFTGLDSLYADGQKTRLYISNKGVASLYTSITDDDRNWVKKGDIITNSDIPYRLSLESDKKYLVIYDNKTNIKLAHINTDAQF